MGGLMLVSPFGGSVVLMCLMVYFSGVGVLFVFISALDLFGSVKVVMSAVLLGAVFGFLINFYVGMMNYQVLSVGSLGLSGFSFSLLPSGLIVVVSFFFVAKQLSSSNCSVRCV
uniref:NADH dehydrogenase subunit 6 n=1 Tax=Pallisentis celatus TaxID=935648 RepID=V5IXC1_PALCE|nr:NADH dehydrogenase subunit 6 [Pallisentis celatus]AFK50133.1 NADH dehydrogenase subunit 6 [Pallisentis celatus]